MQGSCSVRRSRCFLRNIPSDESELSFLRGFKRVAALRSLAFIYEVVSRGRKTVPVCVGGEPAGGCDNGPSRTWGRSRPRLVFHRQCFTVIRFSYLNTVGLFVSIGPVKTLSGKENSPDRRSSLRRRQIFSFSFHNKVWGRFTGWAFPGGWMG